MGMYIHMWRVCTQNLATMYGRLTHVDSVWCRWRTSLRPGFDRKRCRKKWLAAVHMHVCTFLPTYTVVLFFLWIPSTKHSSTCIFWSVKSDTRVTRLGEFSPIGWLITLGSFFLITEVAKIFGLLFSTVKVRYQFWPKSVGLPSWRFFHKLIWPPWYTTALDNLGCSRKKDQMCRNV
jgi:hypothetical protein